VSAAEVVAGTHITIAAGQLEDAAANPIPATAYNVSDVGLGLVEPVWAMNVEGDWTTPIPMRDPVRGGVGRITKFDGRAEVWLQDRNILLQARILEGTVGDISLHFDDAPEYPTRVLGIWVPDDPVWVPPPALTTIATDDLLHVHPLNENTAAVDVTPSLSVGVLRNFRLAGTDTPIFDGAELEFLFLTNTGLPCARIPNPDDPRTATPWLIQIRRLRTQRGDATITNNVINPLRGETATLTYTIPQTGMVTINVFDLKGDIVDVLYRGQRSAGEYSTAWDGRNRGNRVVARGIYFIKIVGPSINEIRKVLVVK